VYVNRLGELTAHQLSTATLLAELTLYIWLMDRRRPIPTTRNALVIGGIWAALTVLFEFGLGHYIVGSPWSELLANYNLAAGRMWVLVPLWMAAGPPAVHRTACPGAVAGHLRRQGDRSGWALGRQLCGLELGVRARTGRCGGHPAARADAGQLPAFGEVGAVHVAAGGAGPLRHGPPPAPRPRERAEATSREASLSERA
jgi:hypothetical protein